MKTMEHVINSMETIIRTRPPKDLSVDSTLKEAYDKIKPSFRGKIQVNDIIGMLEKIAMLRWRKSAQVYKITEELLKTLPTSVPIPINKINLPFDNFFIEVNSDWLSHLHSNATMDGIMALGLNELITSKITGIFVSVIEDMDDLEGLYEVMTDLSMVSAVGLINRRSSEGLAKGSRMIFCRVLTDRHMKSPVLPVFWFGQLQGDATNFTFDDSIKRSVRTTPPTMTDEQNKMYDIFLRKLASAICYLSSDAPDISPGIRRSYANTKKGGNKKKSRKQQKKFCCTEYNVGITEFKSHLEKTEVRNKSKKPTAVSESGSSNNGPKIKRSDHWVRGFWRTQWYGPRGNQKAKPIWIKPYGTGRLRMKNALTDVSVTRTIKDE